MLFSFIDLFIDFFGISNPTVCVRVEFCKVYLLNLEFERYQGHSRHTNKAIEKPASSLSNRLPQAHP